MRRSLFHFLTGIDVHEAFSRRPPPSPDRTNFFFLKEGHMIEYFKIGPGKKRVVALFWEAPEGVIPSHAYRSIFEPLDETLGMTVRVGNMFEALRQYPFLAECYRGVRRKYREKVKARLDALTYLGPKERLAKLELEQPWVFDLVPEEDIANYLRLNVGIVKRLAEI